MSIGSAVLLVLLGAALLWTPQAYGAQVVDPSAHTASCRDSRVSWPALAGSERKLRLEVDADGDGLVDVLEAERSSGSGFSSTHIQLTLGGSGVQLKAEESFDFTMITAINPVPKELLDPGNRAALAWIEEALFCRICTLPDPSLAWLLDPTKRLVWIEGPPEMPDSYAIRLPASRVAALLPREAPLPEADTSSREGTIDPDGEVWLYYAGGVPEYGASNPLELARKGDRVLLGTAHGVILTNPKRSRHTWIYVYEGDSEVKLRFPSIGSARLDGDTAIIRLKRSRVDTDDASAEAKKPKTLQVRVNLNTGAISK